MRPYVICHMCTTIDEKILTRRWPETRRGAGGLFETTAATLGIGSWIVGTTTMKEFADGRTKMGRAHVRLSRGDHIAEPSARKLAVAPDPKGQLRFRQGEVDGDHVVMLVTGHTPAAYLAHLQQAGVSYLECGKAEVDLTTALEKLARAFKLRRLMLQGGGLFNGSMLRAGLVDEVSQLVMPIVDGGMGVSGIFDVPPREAKSALAALRFKSERRLPGGVRWVRYAVVRRGR